MGDAAARIELACLLEAAARKPGNVHPGAAFHDLCFADFVAAAAAIAPVLAETRQQGLGSAILEAVRATRQRVVTNANLGIILLLAPLCMVGEDEPLEAGVERVLEATTRDDCAAVYEAIRLANPGGLGEAPEQDVREVPACTLREAMQLAADRDLVARQYATAYKDAFWLADRIVAGQFAGVEGVAPWDAGIQQGYLQLLASRADTLILRKCGPEIAARAQSFAVLAVSVGGLQTPAGRAAVAELDRWLRADGHRRNPGASADLVAAALWIVLKRADVFPHPTRELLIHQRQ